MQGGAIVHATQATNLADILERVLDKGVVIAGDIRIKLLDIELLTLQLRLVIASVDRAREMGIDWWQLDPFLSSKARENGKEKEEELEALKQRVEQLEACQAPRDARKERSRKGL
ncbi:MAG: gas vesicle protein [Deltaproteobacteria bacterium]|nr:gas vesicle protein [Deltaproteobacteria bacterium]